MRKVPPGMRIMSVVVAGATEAGACADMLVDPCSSCRSADLEVRAPARLVYALRRPGQLVEHALQVERAGLLAWRELDEALDVAVDEGLGRHQQEDAIDAPAGIAHALLVGALERIGLEVE